MLQRARLIRTLSSKRRLLSTAVTVPAEEFYAYSKPPESVKLIPTDVTADLTDVGAFILPLGATRRVHLLKPYLNTDELEGLSFRIKVLTRNEGLSSILIATDDDEDDGSARPLPAQAKDRFGDEIDMFLDGSTSRGEDLTWQVSTGYNPFEVYKAGLHKDPLQVQQLMNGVSDLTRAIRGDHKHTKIPVVTMPHGLVSDAGYAFCSGGYVLATQESAFAILNPSRGLTLDPIGHSYMLPRLGCEFNQPSARFPGCGLILALTGMHANYSDMMETGLATHYVESTRFLPILEQMLMELAPWEFQTLVQKPIGLHGRPPDTHDYNARFRNEKLANMMQMYSTYVASGEDIFSHGEGDLSLFEDPTVDLDEIPTTGSRQSDLVVYAETFDDIFVRENSVHGIMERFREIGSRVTNDREEQEGIDVAKDLVQRMEQQSPLALAVTYRLLQLGTRNGETVESCTEREIRAQSNMMEGDDFEAWGKVGGKKPPVWKYKSVKDVPYDEVSKIIGE